MKEISSIIIACGWSIWYNHGLLITADKWKCFLFYVLFSLSDIRTILLFNFQTFFNQSQASSISNTLKRVLPVFFHWCFPIHSNKIGLWVRTLFSAAEYPNKMNNITNTWLKSLKYATAQHNYAVWWMRDPKHVTQTHSYLARALTSP